MFDNLESICCDVAKEIAEGREEKNKGRSDFEVDLAQKQLSVVSVQVNEVFGALKEH